MPRRDVGQKRRRAEPPPREIVKAAIEAACLHTGIAPDLVTKHRTWQEGGYSGSNGKDWREINRTRAYAMLALRAVYEDTPYVKIAELFNVANPKQWINNIDNQMTGGIRWWRDEVFMMVIEYVEREIEEARVKAEMAHFATHRLLETATDSAGM